MKVSVSPSKLNGQLAAIGSKSYAHRALIAAALFATHPVQIEGITPSEDVAATADCLRALGARITEGEVFCVEPITTPAQTATLNCRESGSTLRFMLPVAAALGVEATFVGSPRLLQRPTEQLVQVLQQGGVHFDSWKIRGKFAAGSYQIAADVSSQFVSGLLFALAICGQKSSLKLLGNPVSQGYVDMTISVLKDFGIRIEKTAYGYKIFGKNPQEIPQKYTVEGDWSNAAFPLVCGALGGDVTLANLRVDSCQGDRQILAILALAGANVMVEPTSVRVCGGNLVGFVVDAQQIPDMVPALSVLAAGASGVSKISGVQRLRQKESDRLSGVLNMLQNAGISARYNGEFLEIFGGQIHGGNFDAANDHRMAMSQTVLALHADGNSQIFGAECVAKSYPKFFEDIVSIGGECSVLEG